VRAVAAIAAPRIRRILLGLVLLGFAGGGLAIHLQHQAKPQPVAVARVVKVAKQATPKRILFVGASYTAGVGAVPATNGYAFLTAKAMGWDARIDAIPGSGYLNPGPQRPGQPPQDGTFLSRLAHIPVDPAPNLVLIQGGRNDASYSEPAVRDAVQSACDIAKSRFVHARIVLLGPIPASVPPDRGELDVARAMGQAARVEHIAFIDPIAEGWITADNELGFTGDVPAHPDNAGYAYIAKRLVTDLDQLLDGSPQPGASEAQTSS
jgi:acyl-CoA thioesterase I